MAFANAFLGINHSLAHKIGAMYHIPHGLANAALMSHVIRYNATDVPFKQSVFPQYEFPQAKLAYSELSDMLGLGGVTQDEKVRLRSGPPLRTVIHHLVKSSLPYAIPLMVLVSVTVCR
jgi:acetaldehyde dehydrogenase/alcohol dehydrogenase